MELTPLANFLMGELGIGSPTTASGKGAAATSPDDDDAAVRDQMEWAKKNSFMPGYVRCVGLGINKMFIKMIGVDHTIYCNGCTER